jgi:hypothetical protein
MLIIVADPEASKEYKQYKKIGEFNIYHSK